MKRLCLLLACLGLLLSGCTYGGFTRKPDGTITGRYINLAQRKSFTYTQTTGTLTMGYNTDSSEAIGTLKDGIDLGLALAGKGVVK